MNSFPGIDVVAFGDSISIILNHETVENESILKMYDDVVEIYKKNYQYEEIVDSGQADLEDVEPIEGGILKDAAKALLLGGMIRFAGKHLLK